MTTDDLNKKLDAMVQEAKKGVPVGDATHMSLYAYRKVARKSLQQLEELGGVLAERDERIKELEGNPWMHLLKDLVDGLDNTHWSSWQTTAHFGDELSAARAALNEARDER